MKRDRRYDWLALAYDWFMALPERYLRPYRQGLLRQAGGWVLDIGVGSGNTLPYYPGHCRILGIDTSRLMLRRAERRARQLGISFTPLLIDAQALAFSNGRFDTVVCSLVLCSVSDPQGVLREIHRVLRPGGRLLLLEHVRPAGTLGKAFDALNVVWSPLVCHLNRETETLVRSAGFDLVSWEAPLSFLRVLEALPEG